jgi:hypothetical protein
MADEIKAPVEAEEVKPGLEAEDLEEDEVSDVEDRTRDFSKLKKVADQLEDVYDMVVAGFEDKSEQNDDIDRFWDVYNCELNAQQSYFGNSQIYVAAVADAVDALTTRDNNMLFPVNGRYASAVGPDGTVPYDVIALLDHYVRQCKMRENIVPCLLRTGKVTGHYLLSIGWKESTRHTITKKKTATIESDEGIPVEGAEEVDDIEETEVTMGVPTLEVKDPRDVCFLPATVDNIADCTIVAERLYFSKKAVQDAIDDDTFDKEQGEALLANFGQGDNPQAVDTSKAAAAAAGIRLNSKGNKVAMLYRVWTTLKLKGKEKRMTVSYFGGQKLCLSCKRNPYWNDKIPLLGQPARKMANSIMGKSILYKVEGLQYALNDVTNEGLDSSQYSLMPITVTDPAKNPRTGAMILSMGALWEADPNSTKFMEFPQLWKEAFAMAATLSDRILQSMGVNPAMLPHGNAGKKPTQAQISQEQQVAQESTADNIAILEEGVFNELLNWFHDLDYQFRKKSISVKQFGQMGMQSKMQEVEPFETYTHYNFRWYGTEGTKAVQQVQQQIAAMNVFTKIPPQQLNGRKVDIGPILEQIAEVAFGPRIAPHVLIDQRQQLSMDPMAENDLMLHGYPVTVQAMDDDVEHLKVHMQAMKAIGGNSSVDLGLFKIHMLAHINQMNAKSQASAGGQPPQGQPGVGAAPPGQPRPGAQPGPPKPLQAPAGAIHQDAIQDPNRMPR